MPITLDDGAKAAGHPVVKATALGQTFTGAVVRTIQRDVLKDSAPVLKANGKPRQKLVVTLVAMPGTTAPVGLGDDIHPAASGEVVRLILRGGAFAQWLDAKKALGRGLQVGDVVTRTTTYGQVYGSTGAPEGPKLATQAQIDAVPRAKSLGIYGDLSIRPATPAEAQWVAAAEAAHMEQRPAVSAEADTTGGDW